MQKKKDTFHKALIKQNTSLKSQNKAVIETSVLSSSEAAARSDRHICGGFGT